jgi:hypothetical protein
MVLGTVPEDDQIDVLAVSGGGARWTLCSSVPPRMAICVCRKVSLNKAAMARHKSRSCSIWRWLGHETAA